MRNCFLQRLTGRLSAPQTDLKPVGCFLGTGYCNHVVMHLYSGRPAGSEDPLSATELRHLSYSSLIHRKSFSQPRKHQVCTIQNIWHFRLLRTSEDMLSFTNTHTHTHWPASPCLHIWRGACCPGSSCAVSSALPGTSPNSPLCSCAPSGTSSAPPEGAAQSQQGSAVMFQHPQMIFYWHTRISNCPQLLFYCLTGAERRLENSRIMMYLVISPPTFQLFFLDSVHEQLRLLWRHDLKSLNLVYCPQSLIFCDILC